MEPGCYRPSRFLGSLDIFIYCCRYDTFPVLQTDLMTYKVKYNYQGKYVLPETGVPMLCLTTGFQITRFNWNLIRELCLDKQSFLDIHWCWTVLFQARGCSRTKWCAWWGDEPEEFDAHLLQWHAAHSTLDSDRSDPGRSNTPPWSGLFWAQRTWIQQQYVQGCLNHYIFWWSILLQSPSNIKIILLSCNISSVLCTDGLALIPLQSWL